MLLENETLSVKANSPNCSVLVTVLDTASFYCQ